MDDKNYLGLGVIFRAVDDGYTKSIDKSVKKAQNAQKILDKVGSVKAPESPQYGMPQGKSFDVDPKSFSMDIGGVTDSHKIVVKSFKKVAIEKDKLIDNFGLYQKTLNNTGKSSKPVEKSSRTMMSILGSMGGILKQNAVRFGNLGKAALLFADPLNKVMSGSGKVSELAKQLDLVQTKMAVVFGPEQAKAFNKELINAVRNYGVTAEQVEAIAKGLNQWGVPIERSNKLMPTMAKMVGIMGMDAGTVADMFGATTQRLGMSVQGAQDLTAEIFAAGQEHGLMDMLENMPGFVETVTESFNRMGKYNTGAATATVKQMANLTIMYNKMGISQKQAAEGAKKVQMGVSSIITDIKRMQVGLDPKDMEGMINVAAELSRTSGMGFEETMALMEQGPEAVQKKMLEISKNLSTDDRFRLGEIMGEKFGDEFALGLKSDKAKDAMESVMAVKTPKGDKATESLDRAMTMQSKTFTMQEKLLQQNQDLVKALGELQAKQGIISGWQAQIQGLQGMQDALNPLMALLARFESAGLSGFFEVVGYIGGGIKALKILGETIGGIIPMFKGLWTTVKGVGESMMQFFSGITRSGKIFGKILSSSFGGIAKVASKLLGPLGAVLGFVFDGMDAVKEKSLGGGIATLMFGKSPEKNIKDVGMAVAGQAMKWGGIGATIGTFIFPGIGSAIGAGIGAALGGIAALIKTYWGQISEAFSWMGNKVSEIWSASWDGIKTGWKGVKEWFSGIFGSLSGSMGNVFANVWDGLKSGFVTAIDFIKNIFNNAVKWIGSMLGSIPGFSTLIEKVGGMFSSSNAAPKADVRTAQAQEDAPKLSRVANYEPRFKEKDSGNTLDDVVKSIIDLRNMIQSTSSNPVPVNVILDGDAKKFLRIVKAESGNRVSVAGMSNALGG
jgi:hypothetical protein